MNQTMSEEFKTKLYSMLSDLRRKMKELEGSLDVKALENQVLAEKITT